MEESLLLSTPYQLSYAHILASLIYDHPLPIFVLVGTPWSAGGRNPTQPSSSSLFVYFYRSLPTFCMVFFFFLPLLLSALLLWIDFLYMIDIMVAVNLCFLSFSGP